MSVGIQVFVVVVSLSARQRGLYVVFPFVKIPTVALTGSSCVVFAASLVSELLGLNFLYRWICLAAVIVTNVDVGRSLDIPITLTPDRFDCYMYVLFLFPW